MKLRMDRRERELEAAPDNVSVTRADRLLGHARWLAERTLPEEFGQRTQIDVTVNIGDTLQQLAERRQARLAVQQTVENAVIDSTAKPEEC